MLKIFRFQPSIHNKVSYGYYICLALIVIVSVSNYLNLKRIERKITFSLIISQCFDATLEMRRFEKNYILYKNTADYNENLKFTKVVEDILGKHKEEIKRFSPATNISILEAEITEYKLLMNEYSTIPINTSLLEGKIRAHGKNILTTVEAISGLVIARMQSLIVSSGRLLIASIMFLIIAGCLIGQYLSRMVVKPLKQLEHGMKAIAEGKFNTLRVDSADMEIISLNNAFKRMMKELELRQIRLIAKSEKLASMGTMLSGLAHQINNPLSNIYTSCQILHEEIEEDNIEYKKELLEQIEEEIERARVLTKSLLDFSKTKEFKSEFLPLKELVEDTLRLLRGDIPPKVEVSVNVPPDIWINANKQLLEHALLNIIKNSVEAIPDEGRVSVSAERNTEANTIDIKIQDTGSGIEADNIGRIFEPFFTIKDEGKGTGLGLFVSHEIISEHKGTIQVKSAIGKGTTFIINLPTQET